MTNRIVYSSRANMKNVNGETKLAKGRQRVMSEMLLSCTEGRLISIETASTLHCQSAKIITIKVVIIAILWRGFILHYHYICPLTLCSVKTLDYVSITNKRLLHENSRRG